MLHLFYGSDGFSIAEAFRELRASLDGDGSLDTNTVTFSASDVSVQEVIAACDTVPFLGTRRMVVVEGALKRGKGGRGKRAKQSDTEDEAEQSAGAWGALAEYVHDIPETTVLVLLDGAVSASALLKSLREHGEVHQFDAPAQKVASDWVQKRAKAMDVKLAGGAAKALADVVGNDTWALAGELVKLDAYAEGRPITADDVREMVSPARDLPPWDLLDPIADGKGASALRALRRMFAKKHPLLIAAIIQSTYRQLAIARDMLEEGASGKDIGQRVGLTGFPLEKLLDRASRYTPAMIREAYARMVAADYEIKSGELDEQLSLELLVTDLAVAASPTRAARS